MASSFYKFAVIDTNDSNEALYSVIANHEGKYVAVGGDKDVNSICNGGGWFVRFDEYGEVEISKNVGESNAALCSITHASVGEYFVTGYKDKKGFVSGNGVLFYGHSVWMTPDGEVIDPTESVNHHKYETTNFIPIFVYQEDGVWSIQMDLMFPDNFEDIGYILLGDIGHKEDMRLTFESLHHYSTFVTKKYTEEELKRAINIGYPLIGINNRNLNNLSVEQNNIIRDS